MTSNTGTILIADDELPQLALVSRVIAPLCHRVIAARNGRDAIEAIEKNTRSRYKTGTVG
jgi:CheY-like chemotaxis protein